MHDSNLLKKLLSWFKANKRLLPWRETTNWYFIWISEVMLQQTQVETVLPFYLRFIKTFGTIEKLAKASQQDVLKMWEGLGYYSRARNLHRAAKIIVSDYNSQIPEDRDELLKIPGFGPYTVNAVLSIAFNQPYGVMDGNVKRVLTRVFEIKDDIRETKTQQAIQTIMDKLLPEKRPGEFNEAVMELGATICKSHMPLCNHCPIKKNCLAYKKNLIDSIPYKSAKPPIPLRQSLACIIRHQNLFLLAKRPQNEMLAGLWEFPVLTENNGQNSTKDDLKSIQTQFHLKTQYIRSWPAIKHTYTHFRYNLYSNLYFAASTDFRSEYYDDYHWLEIEKIKSLPLHKAIWKVLNKVEGELVIVTQRDVINT